MKPAKIKYPNPPIQEAVCEIHFDLFPALNKAKLENIRGRFDKEYPDQKIVEERNIHLQIAADQLKTQEHSIGHRLICKSVDGKKLLQISGTFMAVNQLRPYPGWEESFQGMIGNRIHDVHQLIGDFKFKRIGLRYINKWEVPQQILDWQKWFLPALPIPSALGVETPVFQMRFENKLTEGRKLIINVVTVPPPNPEVSSIVLDLDVIWEGSSQSESMLMEHLEKLHTPLGTTFESYLTDNTRALFK